MFMRHVLQPSAAMRAAYTVSFFALVAACGDDGDQSTDESSQVAAGSSSGTAGTTAARGGTTGSAGKSGSAGSGGTSTTSGTGGKISTATAGTSAATGGTVAGGGRSGGAAAGTSGAAPGDDDAGAPMGGEAVEAGTGGSSAGAAGTSSGTGTGGAGGAGGAGTGGSGGSGAGSGGAGSGASFTQVFTLLTTNCAGSACHANAMRPADGLSFSDMATAYANLVNVDAVNCSGEKRVVPGNPDKSELVHSLQHTNVGSCTRTPRMPEGKPQLAQSDIDVVIAWIQAGAPNN
jgi:hypothetical protein